MPSDSNHSAARAPRAGPHLASSHLDLVRAHWLLAGQTSSISSSPSPSPTTPTSSSTPPHPLTRWKRGGGPTPARVGVPSGLRSALAERAGRARAMLVKAGWIASARPARAHESPSCDRCVSSSIVSPCHAMSLALWRLSLWASHTDHARWERRGLPTAPCSPVELTRSSLWLDIAPAQPQRLSSSLSRCGRPGRPRGGLGRLDQRRRRADRRAARAGSQAVVPGSGRRHPNRVGGCRERF